MGWEERMRDAASEDERTAVGTYAITTVMVGDLRRTIAALDAARAEVERLRAAAADERADVVAQLTKLANFLGRAGTKADTYASDVVRGAAALLAAGTHEGARVGAAKGGDHG